MGREAPDQHDPGREDLRRQIGQVPAIDEPIHHGPSEEKAHACDDGEAPNRLLMRPLAALGVTTVEHVGNEPARDIAAWLGILRQIVWKLRSGKPPVG